MHPGSFVHPLDQLAPQAMAVLVTALRRAGLPESSAASLVRFDERHRRHEVAVETGERPPLRSPPDPRHELSA